MFKYLVIVAIFAYLLELNECTKNRGLTWTLLSHDSTLGIDSVGCQNCEAYEGDTSCKAKRPILCYTATTNFKRPPYNALGCFSGCAMTHEFYDGWSGGI